MFQGELLKDFYSVLDDAKISTAYYSKVAHLYAWTQAHIKYLPTGLMTVEYNYVCFDPDMAVGHNFNMWLGYFL
jgi:hypothetical protein